MDIYRALRELHQERQRLDKVIATLEGLDGGNPAKPKSRRGRKNMPEHERRLVAERMKRYWATKRSQRQIEQPES